MIGGSRNKMLVRRCSSMAKIELMQLSSCQIDNVSVTVTIAMRW